MDVASWFINLKRTALCSCMCLAGSVMTVKATCHRPKPRLPLFLYFKRGVIAALSRSKPHQSSCPTKLSACESGRSCCSLSLPFAFLLQGGPLNRPRPDREPLSGAEVAPPKTRLGMGRHRRRPYLRFLSPRPPVIDLTEHQDDYGGYYDRDNWWQRKGRGAYWGKAPKRSQARRDKENRCKWKRKHGM